MVWAILQIASQRSYVLKYVAKVMDLNNIGKETTTHGLFEDK